MALLQEWREYAYSEEMQNSKGGQIGRAHV